MPTRLSTLLLVASFALAASAQPSTWVAQTASVATERATAPAASYAGFYTADGGTVHIEAPGAALVVTAYGAPVAARLAGLGASDDALDARAESLLDAWVRNDLAPLIASVAASRSEAAAVDLAGYRSALVRGYGEVVAASVVATFDQIDGRRSTLAQVLFEHGTEWVSFVWAEDGRLTTLSRGIGPVVFRDLRPLGSDTFGGADTVLQFDRAPDGRVAGLSVGGRSVAAR